MSGGVQSEALYFFRNALSVTGQDLPDLEMQWLASLGFSQGTLSERWAAYLKAGNTMPVGLERLLR